MGRSSWRCNHRQVTPPQTQGTPFAVSPVARRGGKLLVGGRCPGARGNPADSSVKKTASISSINKCKSQNKFDYGKITDWPHLKRWSRNLYLCRKGSALDCVQTWVYVVLPWTEMFHHKLCLPCYFARVPQAQGVT